jgi:hypothetical protein
MSFTELFSASVSGESSVVSREFFYASRKLNKELEVQVCDATGVEK